MSLPLTPEQLAYYQAREHETLQPDLIAVSVLGLVFGFGAVGLRLAARRLMYLRWGADDWLIVAALFPQTGINVGTIIGATALGMGRHIIYVPDLVAFFKMGVSNILCYGVSMCLTKLSLLALYHRLFPTRWVKWFTIGLGTFVILYSAALIGLSTGRCKPVKKLWHVAEPGSCVDPAPGFLTLAVANALTDVIMLAVPITNVINLQLSRARKISVLGIFCVGGIVCIFGIVRTIAVGQASPPDISWTEARGGLWSQVELFVAIICACLPTYRPLFNKSVRKERSTLVGSGSHRRWYGWSTGWTGRSSRRSTAKDGSSAGSLPDDDHLELQKNPTTVWSSIQGSTRHSRTVSREDGALNDNNIHVKRDIAWTEEATK